MARRNRVNQGPLFIVMLVILAVWLLFQGGDEASLFSPAGMLLLLALILLLNSRSRKKARRQRTKAAVTHSPYGYIPRRDPRAKTVRNRTSRAAEPETWPYDGSYCTHCGLKKRGVEDLCQRCGQAILADTTALTVDN